MKQTVGIQLLCVPQQVSADLSVLDNECKDN